MSTGISRHGAEIAFTCAVTFKCQRCRTEAKPERIRTCLEGDSSAVAEKWTGQGGVRTSL